MRTPPIATLLRSVAYDVSVSAVRNSRKQVVVVAEAAAKTGGEIAGSSLAPSSRWSLRYACVAVRDDLRSSQGNILQDCCVRSDLL